jgi:hypothetical protein
LILQECAQAIYIFPLQEICNGYEEHEDSDIADVLFLKFFTGINSISEYFKKLSSLKDIEKRLNPRIADTLVFDTESEGLSFGERFTKAKKMFDCDFLKDKSDTEIFYLLIKGYLDQGYRTIMLALNFSMTPFLRDSIALYYMMLILEYTEERENTELLKIKSIFANIFYSLYDTRMLCNISFAAYQKILLDMNFDQVTGDFINKYNENSRSGCIVEFTEFIENELRNLHNLINAPPTPRTVDPTTPAPDV